MNMLIAFLFLLAFPHLPSSSASAAVGGSDFAVLLGSEVEMRCSSSFPPPWNKFGPAAGDFRIIGAGGKRHPNWRENRYAFSAVEAESGGGRAEAERDEKAEKTNFLLRISDVRLSDAGRFVCGSDSPETFVLSVVR